MFNDDKLNIELNRQEFDSGDAVSGRVELSLAKPHTCTVHVDLEWRITGKGNDIEVVTERQQLFSGELKAGGHSFPFELAAPHGPFSYEGTHLSVEWGVNARVDIPWKLDPRTSAAFKLNPGEVDSGADFPVEVGSIVEELTEDAGANVILALIGLVLVLAGVWLFSASAIIGVVSMLAGVGFAVPLFITKPIDDIQLTFEPTEVHAGSHLTWRTSYKPKPGVVIKSAAVIFECHEIVVKGAGKNRSVWKAVVFRHEQALPLGAESPFEGTFKIPRLYSLTTRSHDVLWTIGLHIEIAKRPDFRADTKFVVLPPLKQLTADPSPEAVW